MTEFLFGCLQGDALFGNLFLDASKLIVIGGGLLLLRLPHSSEINRDGFKLLLEFCKTFRRNSRLTRCTIVHKCNADTGQNQKQKYENDRGRPR